MGKRGGRKGGDRGGRTTRDDDRSDWNNITPADMYNAAFEEYYRAQALLVEDEWPSFLDSLRTDLPTTFRVTGSRAHAETISDIILKTYVPTMQDVEHEGKKYDPPNQIPWYPDGLAWELSAPKRAVRKFPPFKSFQRFLVGETEVGNLSRQEAVSMIPPLLLDVEPHHICMDMCAAPGSKTAQIIEALNPHHTESTGLLIANDSDYRRTHMLVHQTGRMPSKGLLVTNYDASMLPNISLGQGKTLQFDRILADVPCSGDGTMRKNLEIWKKWSVADGASLHGLQLRILQRAMDLLKPSGRLVYSTCSFNPVENEAVVSAGLNSRPGQFRILDMSDHLPNLRRRQGMTTWRVASQPNGRSGALAWHDSFDAYREKVDGKEEPEREGGKALLSGMWPPENVKELGLEHCLRLVPHDQNTGGFFVCVLEKASGEQVAGISNGKGRAKAPIETAADRQPSAGPSASHKRELSPSAPEGDEAKKARPEADMAPECDQEPDLEQKSAAPNPPVKRVKRDLGFKEDPFAYIEPSHEELGRIVDWYRLKSTFPRDHLMVRNEYGDPLRTIYLTNSIIKSIILNNDFSRLRIVSAGVKAFVRQDSQNRGDILCKWRIPNEGVAEVLPHVAEGTVKEGNMEDLRVLVREAYPPVELFREETRKWLEKMDIGNVLVRFAAGDGPDGHLPLPLVLPVWRAKASTSLLIDKREKSMLSLRTFGEDICKPIPTYDRDKAKGETKGEAASPGGADVLGAETGVDEGTIVEDGAGGIFAAEEAGMEDEEGAANA